jgi:hypothetical protein
MQSDFAAQDAACVAIARCSGFAASAQMVAERDPASSSRGRSTLHGVVFDFFAIRASVMEPNGG